MLKVAAGLMVTQQVAVVIFQQPSVAGLAVLSAIMVVAILVLRGSRVGWVLALVAGLSQVTAPLVLGQQFWLAVSGSIILLCLLSSGSRRYAWPARGVRADYDGHPYPALLAHVLVSLRQFAADGRARLSGMRIGGRQLGICAVVIVVMLPLIGALYDFHQNDGKDSVLIDVLWRVAWICSNALILLFLVALVLYARQRHSSKRTLT